VIVFFIKTAQGETHFFSLEAHKSVSNKYQQGWHDIDRPGFPRRENPGKPGLGNILLLPTSGQYWAIRLFKSFFAKFFTVKALITSDNVAISITNIKHCK